MLLTIGDLRAPPVEELEVEVVERKGRGHPDTICDALVEELSRALSRAYLERFGAVLHHNVDKALLWGGSAAPAFRGGEMLAPIELYLVGRATREAQGQTLPLDELAFEASRAWFRRQLPSLDSNRDLRVHALLRPGAVDLVDLFRRRPPGSIPLANDTSIGVGYAPLSDLERVVAAVEARLNSQSVKTLHPEIGEDIKVLGLRRGNHIALTVACAFIGRHLADLSDYLAKKDEAGQLALQAAREVTSLEISVAVNTADDPARGQVYLTVTGTSAEAGDDGQAGRGNRANGLITPYRPMTLEAAAGKNPVSHVGKLYQVAANRISQAVVAEVPGVVAAECYLVSQIGRAITDPQVADLKLRTETGRRTADFRPLVEDIVERELGRLATLWRETIKGTVQLY
jgi:S-adenosylmethionine synthetase